MFSLPHLGDNAADNAQSSLQQSNNQATPSLLQYLGDIIPGLAN